MLRNQKSTPTTVFGAGLEVTGISVKVITVWLGPVLACAWIWVSALVSLSENNGRLGRLPAPLTLLDHLLQWGGWTVEAVGITAAWLHARPVLAVSFALVAVIGIAARNNLLYYLPLLAGIEAGGLPVTIGCYLLFSAAFALIGATIRDDEDRFFTGVPIATDLWLRRAVGPILTAAIIPIGLVRVLAEPFSLAGGSEGGRGRVAVVDEFIREQAPALDTKISDLDVRTAARLFTVLSASIRDDDRAGQVFWWSSSFRTVTDERALLRRQQYDRDV